MKHWRATLLDALRQDRFAYGVIALGVLIQLVLIVQPLSFLLSNLLPDDAFYYFQIARNIAHGAGSTFDGIHATNGYHPLWLLVLIPIFSLFSVGGVHDTAPIYAALALSVALNVATAVFVLRIVSGITQSRLARAFSVALWALNPFVLFESLNGLETSLALFFLALFFLAARSLERHDRRKDYIIGGLIGGLLILARIDMAFYVAAVAAWIFVRHGLAEGLPRFVRFCLPAGILIAPWFLWNLIGFHMLLTSSAAAASLVNHTLTTLDSGAGYAAGLKAVLYMLVVFGKEVILRTGAAWLVFVFLGAYLAFAADNAVLLPRVRKEAPVFLALFAGFLILFFVDAGVRFTARSYYFISVDLFIGIWAAYVFKLFAKRKFRFGTIFTALFLATLATFGIGWYATLRNQNANQIAMYEMAAWMNERLPAGTPVGVFNAGIMGYFSNAHIVNLDGLVNNAAYNALASHTLWNYLEQERIPYVADFPIYISYRYQSFFGVPDPLERLVPFATVPGATAHGSPDLTLYRVTP